MSIVLWTVKAGAGCTAASLGVGLRAARHEEVLLVDLGGDVPAACGLAEPEVGLTDWLRAGGSNAEALGRLEVSLGGSLSVLPRGSSSRWAGEAAEFLCGLVAQDDRRVVVDAGRVRSHGREPMDGLRSSLIHAATRSVLVTRPCYLALRRVAPRSEPIDVVILVRDQARSLGRGDVADVVGVADVVPLDVDPAIARSIDSGLVASRPPRGLLHQLRRVAA